MTVTIAERIADLLNSRNQLVREYSSEDIVRNSSSYTYLLQDDIVISVCELKKIQWYQFELRHLSVDPHYEGQGFASRLLDLVVDKAKNQRVCIIQSTIRENNDKSSQLFVNKGFIKTVKFHYPISGNNVFVYQKVISEE